MFVFGAILFIIVMIGVVIGIVIFIKKNCSTIKNTLDKVKKLPIAAIQARVLLGIVGFICPSTNK